MDPSTRSLYANVWNQVDGIQIYDMDTFALKGKLEPAVGQTLPKEIQGTLTQLTVSFFFFANCCDFRSMNVVYVLVVK